VTAAPDAPAPAGSHDARIAALERIWANGRGLAGQLTAVNHSTIALRFIVAGFAFLLVGGLLSMFIRLQLAWPGNTCSIRSATRSSSRCTGPP